jgi:choline dehydrogenase-like flavoprotein
MFFSSYRLRYPLNLAWSKYLRPAMGVVMLFHPADTSNENWLRLNSDGTLEVSYHDTDRKKYLYFLVRSFRKIGFYCSMSLAQYPKPGSSLHFAGSLPMKDKPGPYQTDRLRKLYGTQGVYCVDGASLSALPAKNHTLTIMANSLRISRHVREML